MEALGPLFDWSAAPARTSTPLVSVPPAVKRPRPYQLEALHGGGGYVDKDGSAKTFLGILPSLEQHRSTLLVLFTGGGKSFIAAQVAMARPGRTLVLVHTDTLARQFRGELQAITGRPWQLEKAEYRAVPEGGIDVVASVQTLAQPKRLERFRDDAFDTLIVDEAHHYVGEFFGRPVAYFRRAKVLLLTATPNRLDGVAMGTIAESVAYRKDLGQAEREGWSTPIAWKPLGATVDLKGVEVNQFGEFAPGQYDEAIARQIAPVCKAAIEECGSMRTIIFLPGVKAARACAAALNQFRAGSARYVDGSMDQDLCEKVLEEHKRGDFQYLANCRKLTEGYDDPGVVCMIDAAKTKSDSLCTQKVGRVARLWPGLGLIEDEAERRAAIAASPKPRAIWLDLAYSNGIDRLAGPIDVLGGAYTAVERDWAKLFLEKNGGGDVSEALEWGRKHEEILAKRRAQAAAKRAARLAAEEQARATAAAAAGANVELRELPRRRGRKEKPPKVDPKTVPPTEKQANRLRMWDVPVPKTRAEASALISKEHVAREHGWCNYRQREWLGRFGINAWAMPIWKGQKLSAAIVAAGKRRLTDAEFAAALGREAPGADG